MRATVGCAATLSLLLASCFAAKMKKCPGEIQENTANVDITCDDIDSDERVNWIRSKDIMDTDAGVCNPLPSQCLPKVPAYMTLDRPSHGVSHMTIRNVTRNLFGAANITCRTYRDSKATGFDTCALDVVYGSNVTLCRVEPTKTNDKWVLSGSCTISKTFSSLSRYKCQLLQLQQPENLPETSVGEWPYSPTLDSGSPPYASGTCSFSVPLPTTPSSYTYTVVVSPGARRVSAGQVRIALPATPPSIACQSVDGDYVEEDGYLDCSCSTSDVGSPGGRLYAYRDSTQIASGTQGGSTLQLPRQKISRDDDGTIFKCVLIVDWAPSGLQEQSDSFTVSVAYGPEMVNVTDPGVIDVHPSQAETSNLTCTASHARPAVNFTWTGPCAGHNQPKCTFAPKISDNGQEVACIVTNTVTGAAKLASVILDLNFPPPSAPVITGVDNNAILPGEAVLMTCSVEGGIPPVESVTFTCLDQEEEVIGQSSTVNVTVTGRNHGDKCTCTAKWKQPKWYTKSSEVTLKVFGAPEIVSLTLNQTSSILTVQEAPSDIVKITCLTRGIPTPDLRLLRDGGEEVLRQDGGLVVEDMYTTLSIVVPAVCESTAHYKCEADNHMGRPSTATVTLNVQCPPRLVAERSPTDIPSLVYRGKPANLTFDIVAVPPPDLFQFYHLGQQPDADRRGNILIINCVQAAKRLWHRACVITVDLVAEGDEGLYEVGFRNSRGQASFVFNLTTAAPEPDDETNVGPSEAATPWMYIALLIALGVVVTVLSVVVVVLVFLRRRKTGKPETGERPSIEEVGDVNGAPPTSPSGESATGTHLEIANGSDGTSIRRLWRSISRRAVSVFSNRRERSRASLSTVLSEDGPASSEHDTQVKRRHISSRHTRRNTRLSTLSEQMPYQGSLQEHGEWPPLPPEVADQPPPRPPGRHVMREAQSVYNGAPGTPVSPGQGYRHTIAADVMGQSGNVYQNGNAV